MAKVQNLFNRYKKANVIVMTVLIVIAYVGKLAKLSSAFDISMLLVAILGGIPLLLRALSALRFKVISIELLVSIAIISAIIISEYSEAGIVVWLFSFGDLLEEVTLAKTRDSIKELVDLAPKTAIRITDLSAKEQEEVTIDEVEVADQLLVKTGSQIPVDGHVISGTGYVNEASITGESKTAHKRKTSNVFAGTILESGTLIVKAERVGEDTTFGRLIELVEEAQDSQTATQRFIDRFSQYYTPAVLVLALVIGLLTKDFRLAITVLVLGCPGALVIGVPVSTVAGIGSAARQGVMVKGSVVFDELTKVDTFVFDKTGTLTQGQPSVGRIQHFIKDEAEDLKLLASVERESDHPLAKAILSYYGNGEFYSVEKSEIIPGRGIKATVAGKELLIGNEQLLKEQGVNIDKVQLPRISSHVLLAVDGQLYLAIEVSDQLRPDVAETLQTLKKLTKADFILLSGDDQKVAEAVVAELGFTKVYGNLLPKVKADFVKELRAKGHHVAFVGDGINDSPALSTANVAIAMGGGTEVAIETSDIVLVKSQFSKLAVATSYAKKTIGNMYQNIVIALATVVLLFIGLFTGYIYMASGMLVHEFSILIVILNSMRLIKK